MHQRRNFALISLIALVMISSGCMHSGGGSGPDTDTSEDSSSDSYEYVKEGVVVNYSTSNQNFSLVFYDETSESIKAAVVTDQGSSIRRFYKNNWTSPNSKGEEFIYFLSTAFPKAEGEIDSLVQEGGSITIEGSDGSSTNVSRSSAYQMNGLEVYNVTIENADRVAMYHAEEPYLLLRIYIEGKDFRAVDVYGTDSPESYIE